MARKDNNRVFVALGSRDKDGNVITPLDAQHLGIQHMTVELHRVKRTWPRVMISAVNFGISGEGLFIGPEDLEELIPFLQWCLDEMRAYDAKHGINAASGSVRFDKDD